MDKKAEDIAKEFLKELTGNKKWDGIIHYGDQGQYKISLPELLASYHKAIIQDLYRKIEDLKGERDAAYLRQKVLKIINNPKLDSNK